MNGDSDPQLSVLQGKTAGEPNDRWHKNYPWQPIAHSRGDGISRLEGPSKQQLDGRDRDQ